MKLNFVVSLCYKLQMSPHVPINNLSGQKYTKHIFSRQSVTRNLFGLAANYSFVYSNFFLLSESDFLAHSLSDEHFHFYENNQINCICISIVIYELNNKNKTKEREMFDKNKRSRSRQYALYGTYTHIDIYTQNHNVICRVQYNVEKKENKILINTKIVFHLISKQIFLQEIQ